MGFLPFCSELLKRVTYHLLHINGEDQETEIQRQNNPKRKWNFYSVNFSSNGGMSRETRNFYKRLSELISDKHDQSFSETTAWVKRKLIFSLIRTATICIRGSRSPRRNRVPIGDPNDIDIRNNESQMQ